MTYTPPKASFYAILFAGFLTTGCRVTKLIDETRGAVKDGKKAIEEIKKDAKKAIEEVRAVINDAKEAIKEIRKAVEEGEKTKKQSLEAIKRLEKSIDNLNKIVKSEEG